MNGEKRLLFMALVGILLATGIIIAVSAAQSHLPNGLTTVTSTTVTSTSTHTITSTSAPTGVLAAQITDPPVVPPGTTHLYVNYSDIEAHTFDLNNNSVWFTVASAGSIDLMKVVNSGVTLGSSTVASGVFDKVRFDISNATITYYGRNYTASIPLSQIVVPLANGGVRVAPNSTAGFVISVSPTILPSSSGNKISFLLLPSAQGVPIPSEFWNDSLAQKGSTIQNITKASWWTVQPTTLGDNLTIPNHAQVLSSSFLLLALNNTGTAPVTITALNVLGSTLNPSANVSTTTIVSTITTVTTITEVVTNSQTSSTQDVGPHPAVMGPNPFSSSVTAANEGTNSSGLQTIASFQILANGSIIQPDPNAVLPQGAIGLTIRPSQVVVLLFSEPIRTLNSPVPPNEPLSIVGGQQYTIQIVNQYGSTFEFTMNASYQT
ncbi:MAG: hypothetical protein JRN15_05905 [Nitrososphaerota archaeon]|nr:hypothetical protein [Nitrososphaerota archaeon]